MANTPNRGYPLPDETRSVAEEISTLQQYTLVMIDTDIHGLLQALSNLAPLGHSHTISSIAGLADALAAKMPANATFALSDLVDVVGVDEAPNGYLIVKSGGMWVAQASNAALGEHEHTTAQVTGLDGALGLRVRVDAPQTFDAALKAQGRANLGVLDLATAINAGADAAFADSDEMVARRADGSIVRRAWSATKSALNTYFKGLASVAVAAGDLIIGTGANTLGRLAAGTNGFVLTMVGGAPAWAAAQFGSGMDVQTFNSSGTWTKPAGCKWAMIELWGGGAGGGRSDSGSGAGNGGGGGEYLAAIMPISALNDTESVSVGAGGAGRASGGGGLAGGNSSFKGIYARGAPAGASSAGVHLGGGVGSGNNQTAGASGTTNANTNIAVFGGGGGAGAVYTAGFAGGTSLFGGNGGNGSPGSGSPGSQPGGGGGGCSYGLSGAGGAGRVKISCW